MCRLGRPGLKRPTVGARSERQQPHSSAKTSRPRLAAPGSPLPTSQTETGTPATNELRASIDTESFNLASSPASVLVPSEEEAAGPFSGHVPPARKRQRGVTALRLSTQHPEGVRASSSDGLEVVA